MLCLQPAIKIDEQLPFGECMLRTFLITFVISAVSYATLDTVVRMLVH